MRYRDRADGGRRLALRLAEYAGSAPAPMRGADPRAGPGPPREHPPAGPGLPREHPPAGPGLPQEHPPAGPGLPQEDVPVVLALPRGGVPVAAEVARALHAPLDLLLVRKLGVPGHSEWAMGALGEDGVRVLNADVLQRARIRDADLARVEAMERAELTRRTACYRAGRPPLDIAGRTVIVVDDGIATGATARAACRVAVARGASRVVLAAPVMPPDAPGRLADVAAAVIADQYPQDFFGVGQFYRDFTPTSDAQVLKLLAGFR